MSDDRRETIVVRGARQNNLKNLDVEIPTGQLVVVTGVSGSGKSSLVFDTLYAEGQRRYVETFSPYARQFLDRMDKPAVDRIEGIPPAIAIDQTNPVRTSRSTVGTMTELNDHLKLLFARGARLFCRGCGKPVRQDTPASICDDVIARGATAGADARLLVCFPVEIPKNFKDAEVRELLARQGYTRIHAATRRSLDVIQDRLRGDGIDRSRLAESVEAALRHGRGRMHVHVVSAGAPETAAPAKTPPVLDTWRYSTTLHCAGCDIAYREPTPSAFSFNSPVGACEACKGFGRIIGVDYGLVIPDESKTLRGGAIRPWQSESYSECQDDLLRLGKRRGIPLDVPWRELTAEQRRWVIEGEGKWAKDVWYGVRRFFEWLETKAYKMHIRVLLSRYRSYAECTACGGARLKPESLLWRLGEPGLNLHEIMLLPIERTRAFIDQLRLPGAMDQATDLLLAEIRTRLAYLVDVGLGYLTLDRQSRSLSGGEVQRINLTTALGTSLVNTLFVLDEPSIGLHPRDMGRVIDVMHRLRDAGNSLVVVEHDPQIMLEADRILDMGPGAGERGGEIVAFGTPAALRADPKSLTGAWLAGRRQMPPDALAPVVHAGDGVRPGGGKGAAMNAPARKRGAIELRGAAEHNLRELDVGIPLGKLVCVTGVSGSGKSTLVQDVLYPALMKAKGRPSEAPGRHAALRGAELVDDVVMVDQTSIGRTTRSNPASYVGAFDVIRERFAKLPQARERGYTAGTFSFNSGTGRCPSCGGNGFEHVEMQFLSDVYLRCGDCNGRRYRAETLEVTYEGRGGRRASIADVLDMTVTEALAFFADAADLAARLAPLADVGLDYLKLGQPVPTLSGGEAQRLKLAGHLAEAGTNGGDVGALGKLFLFDEPTTGLHFEDVARLLRAFRKLQAAGHSLLVIEHNLDVIRSGDWVIDLGPEGGDAGGRIVAACTPAELAAHPTSHTGRALAEYAQALAGQVADAPRRAAARTPRANGVNGVNGVNGAAASHAPARRDAVVIHNAREHNLRSIDVEIPHEKFTVLTGVSGSGKSTLAFDILFNEGQRRYLESLNAYARQFVQPSSRPEVDAIFGIPPTVAIEQRTSRGGRKSTVATLTEVYHFLRLLYIKLGTQHCPDCNVPIEPQSPEAILARLMQAHRGRKLTLLAPLVTARKGLYTDLAKWAAGKGYAQLRVDGELTPVKPWPRLDRFREHSIELPVATVAVGPQSEGELRAALAKALEFGKGIVHALPAGAREVTVLSTKRACPSCGTSFAEPDPRMLSFNSKHGWCESCLGTGLELPGLDAESVGEGADLAAEPGEAAPVCESCHGERLNPVARHLRFRDRSIGQLTAEPVSRAAAFLGKLRLGTREAAIGRDLLAELAARLGFLERVGLGYLQLDRAAPTLSGGEAQRIRLAAQLGSNLKGVCYVLDEPTIGLHTRDNRILLDALAELAAHRNTLVVVEHDEDTIRRADHVIDLGPGAGVRGGTVVAAGRVEDLVASEGSLTGRFLREPLKHPAAPRRPVEPKAPSIRIEGATLHNLRDVEARFPLGRLVVVTGVSGSGKSTLARDLLYDNARARLAEGRGPKPPLVGCERLEGLEGVDRVLEVDQTPIGKTPRSCPATYVGIWDEVRKLFAGTAEARMRGWTAGRFSFNAAGGRCEACEGQGVRTIEMSFLPDVKLLCDACGGRRFNGETLQVTWRERSIADVLAMSIEDAAEFFRAQATLHHVLSLLVDVGLGYLTLGQQSPTLSGGEAQRIKLVTELAKVRTDLRAPLRQKPKHTLYVLDEPTVGLHMADVEKLIRVLHRLVDAGNTVVVVEHDLDVIAEADWVIDMGPEAGDGGGRVVAQASPQDLAKRVMAKRSHTGQALAEFLQRRIG
ncbi:MAG: excinuclease ABC subunit UvrA [Steroidobacteraceae bacterium]|jgi:excinuclease ABC subunit A|nr:excinuclease ABC subunit UvrA [Steroidobacteraceae bacterium]